jgi:hypothetical protein
MPNAAGSFKSSDPRRILFYDDHAIYEANDIWEGYWEGFLGFTPYFRQRGHVFKANAGRRKTTEPG